VYRRSPPPRSLDRVAARHRRVAALLGAAPTVFAPNGLASKSSRERLVSGALEAVGSLGWQHAGLIHGVKEGRSMKRTLVAVGLALATAASAAVFASTAAADRPIVSHFTFTFTATLTDACSFPITVDSSADLTETDFVDQSGALTRISFQGVEQDIFSANGNTLVGEPFHLDVVILFDSSGNVTHAYGQGITEVVRLPDGSLFIAAGRVDFVAHGGPPFLLTPDVGATVNLAGFCAALAP
jgi:hypothetical protein